MKYLFLIILFVSCASNEKKLNPAVSKIKNSDFKPKRVIKYSKKQDSISIEDKAIEKEQVLSSESLQRGKIFEELDSNNDLNKLSKLCYEEDFSDAFKMIKSIRESYQSNVIFWNQVATCFMLQGKKEIALLYYNKGLELNNSYAPILNNIGVMYEKEEEFEKALISYKKAMKANKYAKTPKYNAALLYLKFKLPTKASELLKGLSTRDNEVKNLYAQSLLMNNKLNEALNVYANIPKNKFEEAEYGINYSHTLFLLKKEKQARDIFSDIDISKKSKLYFDYQRVGSFIGVKI